MPCEPSNHSRRGILRKIQPPCGRYCVVYRDIPLRDCRVRRLSMPLPRIIAQRRKVPVDSRIILLFHIEREKKSHANGGQCATLGVNGSDAVECADMNPMIDVKRSDGINSAEWNPLETA